MSSAAASLDVVFWSKALELCPREAVAPICAARNAKRQCKNTGNSIFAADAVSSIGPVSSDGTDLQVMR